MTYTSKINPKNDPNAVYAYAPDYALRKLIGPMPLSDIFTPEKIAACQKILDDAKASFFETSSADMEFIRVMLNGSDENHQQGFRQLFEPLANIKGQADVFGFPLISSLCKYLIEYTEEGAEQAVLAAKNQLIIQRLSEALQKAFDERVVDAGGALERELIDAVKHARLASSPVNSQAR